MEEQEATEFLENLLEEIGQRRLSEGRVAAVREEEALVD